MERDIRLTTGVEFAKRDAPSTPVAARPGRGGRADAFSLADGVEATPWRGARPIVPDSRPLIGPAPRHGGLWLAFAHQHLGFTLGPATGRLLAELITGEEPFVDPAPFSPQRF